MPRGQSNPPAAFDPAALRQVSAEGIPSRVGRPTSTYPEWKSEIDAVREAVGTDNPAFHYDGVPNVSTVVSGLKRTYGVIAAARNVAEDKSGTLWIQYPFTEDGTPDEDEAQNIREAAKKSKK